MSALLEALMLICFGASWPVNAYKSYKAKTAIGTSSVFLTLITIGYIFGICAKVIGDSVNWVLFVYIVNLVVVSVNWVIYFRNKHFDRACNNSISSKTN